MTSEEIIRDILGHHYKKIIFDGIKKYENDFFLIMQFHKHFLVVDKRHRLPQIYNNLLSAYNIIKLKSNRTDDINNIRNIGQINHTNTNPNPNTSEL